MGDRWMVIWPSLVLVVVLIAVAAIVVWRPPESDTLRTVTIRPVVPPTPALVETPWRRVFTDIELPSTTVSESQQTSLPVIESLPTPFPTEIMHPDVVLAQKLLGWVYVGFSQVGTRRGTIEDTIRKRTYQVYEGYELPGKIIVETLTPRAATVSLDSATYELEIVRRPAFMDRPDLLSYMPTEEEQNQAREYYNKLYRDKLADQGKHYKPVTGVKVPHRPTKEEEEIGKQEYEKNYGQKFREEQQIKDQIMQTADPALQKELRIKLYLEWWKRKYPDKEPPIKVQEESP